MPSIAFAANSELDCLARNIYHESAGQPEEGMVAVGVVTLNRVGDSRFSSSVCGVVNQRVTKSVSRTVLTTKEVSRRWVGTQTVTVEQTIWNKINICQFSWKCQNVKAPKKDDSKWEESLRIAKELLSGGYEELRVKYSDALFFHARQVRPSWAPQKRRIERIGGHIFYADI